MAFLVLEAITPWVMEFARSLSAGHPVTALQHVDIRSQRVLQLPKTRVERNLTIKTSVFPPGFAGRLSALFAPAIQSEVESEIARLHNMGSSTVHVICPYPYTARWTRSIPSDNLIYLNLDDYEQYAGHSPARIRRLEDELIARCDLSVCLSAHQVRVLKSRHPAKTTRIHHFPLGVAEGYINPEPEVPPKPALIGYVGNLTDRVDWAFVHQCVRMAPELTFDFVGRRTGNERSGWATERAAVFDCPNVRYLGPVTQAEVRGYYWRSAVNWMPYDTNHPFNIASSPTKIFDALASGRPFLSTNIPEVQCYPEWITIVQEPSDAAAALHRLVNHDADRARDRVQFAKLQTWPKRAEQFIKLLSTGRAVQ